MLDKLIRSMFHGNTKTKLFLWTILILGMAALGMLVIAIALGQPQLGVGAVALGFVVFVASQSVSIETLEKSKQNQPQEHISFSKDPRDPKEKERAKARYLASLDEKSVKKMLRGHKVKQMHIKVMIDSYGERKLNQVPAFVWRTDDQLHFLVLEGHANEFEIPLKNIKGIYLEKNVEADPENEYVPFHYETYIAKLFAPYLPEYYEHTQEGKISYRKNLFRLEQDLYITNSSVANMMSILPHVPFLIDDGVCRSKYFNEYFKELYRYSVLCKNLVITLDEYREQVERTLDSLLEAPISAREFVQTIQAMARYRLIDRDNVAKYSQKYRTIKNHTTK